MKSLEPSAGNAAGEPASAELCLGTVAMVARWKPVHLGHAAVLRGLVRHSTRALIGIGSSNKYDVQNPFTAEESADMIRAALGTAGIPPARYHILPVKDLGHGPRWRAMVHELLGPVDVFVTANAYVRDLMAEHYPVVHPARLVLPEERRRLSGTMVREAMARGEAWRDLVPPEIAAYLDGRELVARFRTEFGAETLARAAPVIAG